MATAIPALCSGIVPGGGYGQSLLHFQVLYHGSSHGYSLVHAQVLYKGVAAANLYSPFRYCTIGVATATHYSVLVTQSYPEDNLWRKGDML